MSRRGTQGRLYGCHTSVNMMIKMHDKSLFDEIDVQCCMFALSAVQVDTCDDSALSSIADAAATATLVPRNCVQNKAVSPSSTSNTLCWWRPVPNISQRWCNARDGNRNNLYGLLNSRYALPFTKPLQVSCNLFSLQRVNHCAGSGNLNRLPPRSGPKRCCCGTQPLSSRRFPKRHRM